MNKFEKFAVYKGLAVVSIAGSAILLAGKLLRNREKRRAAQGELEVVMSAGDIETGEEAWEISEEAQESAKGRGQAKAEAVAGTESEVWAAAFEEELPQEAQQVRKASDEAQDVEAAAFRTEVFETADPATVEPASVKDVQSGPAQQIVRILPCGPLTERVQPTEAEKKDHLRRMLNQVIRF